MNLNIFTISMVLYLTALQTTAIRLTRLFQVLTGTHGDSNVRGILHVGSQYGVFLRMPSPYDKNLIYELYEINFMDKKLEQPPKLVAISKVPVEYIKDQLQTFREELLKAKYDNPDVVPGVKVQSMREWQIAKAMAKTDTLILKRQPDILRMISENHYI